MTKYLVWALIPLAILAESSLAEPGKHFVRVHEAQAFATVNAQQLNYNLFEFLLGSRAQDKLQNTEYALSEDEQQQHIMKTAKDLVVTELLAQEASRQKIDQLPTVITELEMARKTLLAQLLVQKIMQDVQVDEAQLIKRYEQQEALTMYRFKVWNSKHQEEAEHILKTLKSASGSDSEAYLAQANETAWVLIDDVDPALRDEVKQLPVGGFASKPSNRDRAWQIIQLIDKNTLEKRPFEEERDILRSDIIKAELDKEITKLLKNATIKVHKPEGIVIDRHWSQGE
ncbi:MAG: peptidylprolyl isomerase [Oleiphilus sp.]